MPHRRTIRKGSFDGRFDELVKQFRHDAAAKIKPEEPNPAKRAKRERDLRNVHDRLLERASKEAREQRNPPS
jgi:hypothetical protein